MTFQSDSLTVRITIQQHIDAYLQDDEHKDLFSLSDVEAQIAVDEVWMRLRPCNSADEDHSHVPRSRSRRLLLKLALQYNKLPTLLVLKSVKCTDTESQGSGGFADVFTGIYNGAPVALKRLRAYASAPESQKMRLRQAFYREVLLWMNLSHNHILPFLGISEDVFRHGTICMVLPWMPNGSVRHYKDHLQKQGKLTGLHFFEHVDRWLHEIAQGLSYLHQEGIVHGDLHGGNILVDSDGTTRLADFGMALIADATSYNYASVHGGGATRWQAPELIDPEAFGLTTSRATFACDVYSFAFVCIELYTGQIPFAELADLQIVLRVLQGLRPERPILPDGSIMPNAIWTLTMLCWAAQPSDRPLARRIADRLSDIRRSYSALKNNVTDTAKLHGDPQVTPEAHPQFAELAATVTSQPASTVNVVNEAKYTISVLGTSAPAKVRQAAVEDVIYDDDDEDTAPKKPEKLPLPSFAGSIEGISRQLSEMEERYIAYIDLLESDCVVPLRTASPPILPIDKVEDFLKQVFRNIFDLRDCSRRLLDAFHASMAGHREVTAAHVVARILLSFMLEFRQLYLSYASTVELGHAQFTEYAKNNYLRYFLKDRPDHPSLRRLTLHEYLDLPADHLWSYVPTLEAMTSLVADDERDVLAEAISAIANLHMLYMLRVYQGAGTRARRDLREWAVLVPEEMRHGLSRQELRRQSVLFELVDGEIEYVSDMEFLLNTFAAYILGDKSPVSDERKRSFVHDVFGNLFELLAFHKPMLSALQKIQFDQWPVVNGIAAVLFDTLSKARQAYITYTINAPLAAYYVERETIINHEFKNYHDLSIRHPSARRLDLRALLIRPIPRLLRYQLILSSVLRDTPEDHLDQTLIPQCLDLVKAISEASEGPIAAAQAKVQEFWKIPLIIPEQGQASHLVLEDNGRVVVHRDKVLIAQGPNEKTTTPSHAVIFEHLLVFAGMETNDGGNSRRDLRLLKKPIPLELITEITSVDVPRSRSYNISRYSGTVKNMFSFKDKDKEADEGSPQQREINDVVYMCSIVYAGKKNSIKMTLQNSSARDLWMTKLQAAIDSRNKVIAADAVFNLVPLHTIPFMSPSVSSENRRSKIWISPPSLERIYCSLPFELGDGETFHWPVILIGTDRGIYGGLQGEAETITRLAEFKSVTQCVLLSDSQEVAVLADGIVYILSLNELFEAGSDNDIQPRKIILPSSELQRPVGSKQVSFFRIGQVLSQDGSYAGTVLVLVTNKSSKSSFVVLESVNPAVGFKILREFSLPFVAYDMIFVGHKFVVLTDKGFMLMESIEATPVAIPIFATLSQDHDNLTATLAKRCALSRPISLLQTRTNEFLLCYDDFGLYLDVNGRVSRFGATIEWRAKAESAAMHPPYFLLFNKHFIEIRDLATGRPLQYIPNNSDIRCSWDSMRSKANCPQPDLNGWSKVVFPEPQVHVVMGDKGVSDTSSSIRSQGSSPMSGQIIFELVPVTL